MKTREVKLGEVANVKGGKRIPKGIGLINIPNGHPYIRVRDLNNKRLLELDNSYEYVDNETQKVISKYTVKTGDVVLSIVGTIGLVAIVGRTLDGANLTENCVKLSSFHGVNRDFLYYYLRSDCGQQEIRCGTVGAVQAKLPIKNIQNIAINLPDYTTQERIVSLLLSIDRKIELNQKINDNLFAQMQALYAAWFIDCIPFGGIKPSSWQKTSIYTIADIIYGAPFSSKQFNTDGKGIPIIRIRDLKEQKVATYTTEKHPKGYLLQAGDIVVGMDGEFVPYIWGSDEAWLNQRVCVFKNKRLKGKAFLYFTIKPLLYAIEQTQVATTVIHIGKKDFDAFEITLPDPRVLDSFDAITTPMVEKIVENRFEIKQLELLRDALLPKLMSGELDVSNIQL